jgi:hypothetical protein
MIKMRLMKPFTSAGNVHVDGQHKTLLPTVTCENFR